MTMQNNHHIALRQLAAFPGVRTVPPGGACYCVPDFHAYRDDSVALSYFLLETALVVTVPGKEFGIEGRLRLSFAGSPTDVSEGIARIRWALDPNAADEIYIGDRKKVRDWA
jgi:aspartate aminotransferase